MFPASTAQWIEVRVDAIILRRLHKGYLAHKNPRHLRVIFGVLMSEVPLMQPAEVFMSEVTRMPPAIEDD